MVSMTILAFVALSSLAACKGGAFEDPGHAAAYGGGGGSDREYDDWGDYDDDDDDYSSKPSSLSTSASLSAAQSKVNEIIAYCDSHSGNDSVKTAAQATRSALSYLNSTSWSSTQGSMIATINGLIGQLK
jgi:hypothetical protein